MMVEFQKAGMKLEMKQEMMNDAMDLTGADAEAADDVYDQILGEMNLEIQNGVAVGTAKMP